MGDIKLEMIYSKFYPWARELVVSWALMHKNVKLVPSCRPTEYYPGCVLPRRIAAQIVKHHYAVSPEWSRDELEPSEYAIRICNRDTKA